MKVVSLDDFGASTISFDGVEAKVKAGITTILPSALFIGVDKVTLVPTGDEVAVLKLHYASEKDTNEAMKSVQGV